MKKAIPLLLFMAGIQGWVLSLPLFGPLLAPLAQQVGADPFRTGTLFLNFYAFSFAAWGIILHQLKLNRNHLLMIMGLSVLICLLLSFSLLWVDALGWTVAFTGIGLFASLPSLGWLYLISTIFPYRRLGFAFGVNGLLVSVVHFAIQDARLQAIPGLILASAFIVLALCMLPFLRHLTPVSEQPPVHKEHSNNPLPLLLMIFLLFPLGGIMYQVVNPFLEKFDFINNYAKLPYLLAMPPVGWIMDRQGYRSVVYGMAILGLAYTIFAFSTSFGAAVAGSILLQIGFAFLDVFVLHALATWKTFGAPFRFIGLGLGVYIISIRAGIALNGLVIPFSQGNYMIIYLCALAILLISFLLVHWLGDVEPREVEKRILFKELSDYYQAKDEELKLARQVQQQMLPTQYQLPHGMEAAVTLKAAKEVGGDFYDILHLGSKRALFVIGDVIGQGLPAALVMSTVVGLIRSEVYHKQDLTSIIKQLNRILHSEHSSDMLVTLGLALIDQDAKTLTYASAGHVSPYLIRDQRIEPIHSSSFPIGVDLECNPYLTTVSIERNDIFVMYTDGIIELHNQGQQMYGFERLESVLLAAAAIRRSPNEMASHILSDIQSFADKEVLDDDMALLIVKINHFS